MNTRSFEVANASAPSSNEIKFSAEPVNPGMVISPSGTKVVYILTAFPLFFLAFSYLMNPSGTATVFQSLLGQIILLVVIALCYFSFRWSQKILAIEV